MRNVLRTLLLLISIFSVAGVSADEAGWTARVQVINVNPEVKSSLDGLDIGSNTTAALNLTYHFDKNLAIDVLACCFTRHKVTLDGLDLGKVSLLPPTVTAQYHFPVNDKFIPYVGAGFNYTHFFNVDLGGLQVDKTSTGLAFQVGFNMPLDKNHMINFDIKKIKIGTEVTTADGAPVADVDIDPVIIGLGYSWRL